MFSSARVSNNCNLFSNGINIEYTIYRSLLNALSDTGSTPVRSACFMTHIEIGNFVQIS